MEEEQFQQTRNHGIDPEEDLDKILQFLAREQPLQSCNAAMTTTEASQHYMMSSGCLWTLPRDLLSPPFFPIAKNSSALPPPANAVSALRGELLESDLSATSRREDLRQQETYLDYPRSTGAFQHMLHSAENERELMAHISQIEESDHANLLGFLSTSALNSPGISLAADLFHRENSQNGAGSGSLLKSIFSEFHPEEGSAIFSPTTNSSFSSSVTDEAHLDEECSHTMASACAKVDTVVVGSKRKAATMASTENFTSTTNDKKSQEDFTATTHEKKESKTAAKKGKKRIREPRYAIQTRSDKDILEDGYKWRKYGQKAVKNSPHPRSYYRCTYAKCLVKKMVERSSKDPGLVVTTYEGVHIHPSPAAVRNSIDTQLIARSMYSHFPSPHVKLFNAPRNNLEFAAQMIMGQQYHIPQLDRGLLEDILPSGIRM